MFTILQFTTIQLYNIESKYRLSVLRLQHTIPRPRSLLFLTTHANQFVVLSQGRSPDGQGLHVGGQPVEWSDNDEQSTFTLYRRVDKTREAGVVRAHQSPQGDDGEGLCRAERPEQLRSSTKTDIHSMVSHAIMCAKMTEVLEHLISIAPKLNQRAMDEVIWFNLITRINSARPTREVDYYVL